MFLCVISSHKLITEKRDDVNLILLNIFRKAPEGPDLLFSQSYCIGVVLALSPTFLTRAFLIPDGVLILETKRLSVEIQLLQGEKVLSGLRLDRRVGGVCNLLCLRMVVECDVHSDR